MIVFPTANRSALEISVVRAEKSPSLTASPMLAEILTYRFINELPGVESIRVRLNNDNQWLNRWR